MQARFYDPQVGRFLSTDPQQFDGADPFTFNRYSYDANLLGSPMQWSGSGGA